MVNPRARHRGRHKDLRGQEKGETVTSPGAQAILPSKGGDLVISNSIQSVTPVETKPVVDEEQLLLMPIKELRKQGDRGLNPKILLFQDAILEGQLSSQEMQAARGKSVGETPEEIASMLVNSAVDNSAL